jgi:hypothetical protein
MLDLDAIKQRWQSAHWQYGQNSLSPEYIGDAWVYTPDLYTGTGEPLMHIGLDEPNPVEVDFLRLAAHAPGDIQALIAEVERLQAELAAPKAGDLATCSQCGQSLVYNAGQWWHAGVLQPRHPALPKED